MGAMMGATARRIRGTGNAMQRSSRKRTRADFFCRFSPRGILTAVFFGSFGERRRAPCVGPVGLRRSERSSQQSRCSPANPQQPNRTRSNKAQHGETSMKRTILALLATTALAAPALAANTTTDQSQQPTMQQQQQPAGQQQSQAKPQDQQQQQQAEAQQQNGNQPIQPNDLSRSEVKQMQQALDQQGFNAGKPDGKFGPRTRQAVRQFDQKKGIQSQNGQPTEQTLAELGVNQNQDQSQQPQDRSQQPQNGSTHGE
jgi:hypothetical protein